MSAVLFNPFAPGFTDNPYPHYRELRDTNPVQDHPLGFWVLSRHADVTTVLRAGLSAETRHLAPNPTRDAIQDAVGSEPWRSGGRSMIDRDPPDHTRLRGLVAKVFTPRAIAALEPRVTELVDGALDTLAAQGGGDLVEELAFPLPFTVINEMLGMPPTDADRVRALSGLLVRSLEPLTDVELARRIRDADHELSALVREVIAWKRAHPADDLLTALVQAESEGDKLTDDELVAQVVLLYVAGHETTVNLVSNGVVALLRNPDQLAALRADPELVGNAVEELLRFDSPVQSSRRITVAPFEVGGREIPAGTFVIANLAAANTDERFWGPDAAELRLDRANARNHVSFGAGPHHCLGAALARLEGRVAIGGLVQRFPDLALAGQVVWNGRINLRGAEKVPITV
ncbi:cytochrome P450 [Actinokineospora sp. NBRC 105648]|uniref:cytochrome P450 n=1 Tax=Actinokineospora sp. NBRC 105648 TaxID=3032206 RepID=UPI0024A133FE|nr:cytochrome P450 [Actinokineospora sp. NBRC 105648]GLZ39615.1 cytochrome P450 [Actinokineospora sp. NBRC 105648]